MRGQPASVERLEPKSIRSSSIRSSGTDFIVCWLRSFLSSNTIPFYTLRKAREEQHPLTISNPIRRCHE